MHDRILPARFEMSNMRCCSEYWPGYLNSYRSGPVTIGLVVILTAAASDDPWKALYVAIFLIILRILMTMSPIRASFAAVFICIRWRSFCRRLPEQVAGILGALFHLIVAVATVFYRHILEHQGRRTLFSHRFEEEDELTVEENA